MIFFQSFIWGENLNIYFYYTFIDNWIAYTVALREKSH